MKSRLTLISHFLRFWENKLLCLRIIQEVAKVLKAEPQIPIEGPLVNFQNIRRMLNLAPVGDFPEQLFHGNVRRFSQYYAHMQYNAFIPDDVWNWVRCGKKAILLSSGHCTRFLKKPLDGVVWKDVCPPADSFVLLLDMPMVCSGENFPCLLVFMPQMAGNREFRATFIPASMKDFCLEQKDEAVLAGMLKSKRITKAEHMAAAEIIQRQREKEYLLPIRSTIISRISQNKDLSELVAKPGEGIDSQSLVEMGSAAFRLIVNFCLHWQSLPQRVRDEQWQSSRSFSKKGDVPLVRSASCLHLENLDEIHDSNQGGLWTDAPAAQRFTS